MAESDRSRSPAPGRNRAEPEPSRPPVRQDLPFFPRWCGPMQSAIWHSQQMLRPQSRPQFQPQFNIRQPGPYMMTTSTDPSTSMTTWPNPRFPSANPRFPPAPPSSPPPTLAYPRHNPDQLLHHVHLRFHVLQLNWLRPALHRSRRHNLAIPALHSPSHQGDRQPLMKVVHMASILTLTGKKIKTTTTIRRSTV